MDGFTELRSAALLAKVRREDAAALRELGGEEPGQHARAALGDEPAVERVVEPHRRDMPSRLTRKLASTVWKPSAASVTPGTTWRMVRA